ncbi:nucleoside-diphosphate kinase [Actinomycetaceae bacterium TAE3-ERU4]|nr:nucleoside-diphosphate kinase [Actinomycetaceae bacterium TAE3-ERU4]
MSRTLVLIKPDAVARGLVGKILSRFESRGFTFSQLRVQVASKEQLDAHYSEHVGKDFYPAMAEYMSSGPLVAVIIEGEGVQEAVRSMMGATMPSAAAPGTIRGDYSRSWADGVARNVIHGSDSYEAAEREISIWFPSN